MSELEENVKKALAEIFRLDGIMAFRDLTIEKREAKAGYVDALEEHRFELQTALASERELADRLAKDLGKVLPHADAWLDEMAGDDKCISEAKAALQAHKEARGKI